MVKTMFDTLMNAKTALYLVSEFLEFSGLNILVFFSGTLVDQQSGRALSGRLVRHSMRRLGCEPDVLGLVDDVAKKHKPRKLPDAGRRQRCGYLD